MPKSKNRYLQALMESGNLAGVLTVAAAGAIVMNPAVLLAGLAAEAAYLIFVPDSRWYASVLDGRGAAEKRRLRHELKVRSFAQMDDAACRRYDLLETIRAQIESYARNDPDMFAEVLAKLDYLMDQFLRFATKEKEFRQYVYSVWRQECPYPPQPSQFGGGYQPYLNQQPQRNVGFSQPYAAQPPVAPQVPPEQVGPMVGAVQASYDAQVKRLGDEIAQQADEPTKAVKQKRVEVLTQRRESVAKIGRIAGNLSSQLDLVEDTFGLINDQIRARSPEQLLSDVESAVMQTDSMTTLLEDLAPLERAAA